MTIRLPKIKTVTLAYLMGCVISWLIKESVTPLIFNGMTFEGRSTVVKFLLVLSYAIIPATLCLWPASKLINPILKAGRLFLHLLNLIICWIKKVIFIFKTSLIIILLSGLVMVGNVWMVKNNISGLPQNGILHEDDLTQLIQIAYASETENFAFGNYSKPQKMSVKISPEIVKWLEIDVVKIRDVYKPFQAIDNSNTYPFRIEPDDFEKLTTSSAFTTWRQINGHLYYYFFPFQDSQVYYTTLIESDIVFLPQQLYESLGLVDE